MISKRPEERVYVLRDFDAEGKVSRMNDVCAGMWNF